MKVLSLQADNFKRLRAIAINPTGNVVEITGQNGEGKTSTLDAIWAAVGGKDAVPSKPIHTGAETAEIRLVLGDDDKPALQITRTFKLKEGVPYSTGLIVESAKGARFSSPQAVLDALVGSLCFDPLAFTRLKDEEQIKTLRRFVPDVDFATLEGLNRRDYDERTDVNRRAREYRAQATALPTFAGDEPKEADEEAIIAKLGAAAEIEQRRGRRAAALQRRAQLLAQIEQAQKAVEEINEQIAAEPEPEDVDVAALQAQLAEARTQNAAVAKYRQRVDLEQKAQDAEEASALLSKAIEDRTEAAAEAVRQAEMPIPGLGFGDGVVTLNGEPFAQASMAEKIRASVAIAAAMNPKLRVARVSDGSLLDKKSWAALQQYADKADLQIWVETVDPKSPAAVHIVDGAVVAASDATGDVI